jgi:signal transduction histidine kinase
MSSQDLIDREEPPALRRRQGRRFVEDALAAARAGTWSWEARTGTLRLDGATRLLLGADPATLDELDGLVLAEDRAARRDVVARAIERGEAWGCTFRLTGGRWVEERGRATAGDGGARAVALLLDVGDRKRVEDDLEQCARREAQDRRALARSEAFLETMFAALADALIVFGPEGRVQRLNPAARQMLGVEPGEPADALGACLDRVRILDVEGQPLPPAERPERLALRGAATRGQALCLDFPDGRKVWVSAGAAPIHATDGRIMGAVVSLGDVTRLREAQEQREDLSRMISHDLRTPLNVVLAHAKLLGRRTETAEAVRTRADAIATSAQRMAAMLNDLVESALLEAGKLRLELAPLDLYEVVRDLRGRLAAPYEGDRIRVTAQAGVPRVLADPDRLERVVVNLLTNALKYSAPGSEVLVRVSAEDDGVQLSVEDRGQGIAPEDLPRLFERFFRAPGAGRVEGMGLGLYTCRKLVEAHGGAIGARSERGKGSLFWVRLPPAPGR